MVACRETRQKPQESPSQKEIADGHKNPEKVFSADDEEVDPLEQVPARCWHMLAAEAERSPVHCQPELHNRILSETLPTVYTSMITYASDW